MKKDFKQFAFTLAETLIVMGIIGVVAALTIPSLTNSTNNKDIVAKVRKAHTNLEDAFGRMVGTYGEIDEWGGTLDSNTLGKRMIGSMKLTKNCGIAEDDANKTCFGAGTQLFKNGEAVGVEKAEASKDLYKVIKADGVSLGISVSNASCGENAGDKVTQDLKEICGFALIDVDGPNKGKNRQGQDLFQFYITKKGVYPVGSADDDRFHFEKYCTHTGHDTTAQSPACTAWVVVNANLDYKKATSEGKCQTNSSKELDFTTNTSCD